MAYLGKLKAESANTEGLYEFTATSGQTTFACLYTIGHIEIFLNGVRLASTDFTATTGTSVVLTVPATLGDNVQIKTQNINGLVDGYSNVEVDALLNLKANLASPSFTGLPTLPTGTIAVTQTVGDSSTKVATTAFVKAVVDAKFVNTVLTGTPTAPTATSGTNTTQVATTAFVNAEISNDVGVANSGLVKTALNATGTAPIYACRAWVNFNGSTMVIYASQNISSITDNAVGDYTLNFTTSMPDAGYTFPAGMGRTDTTQTALQARVVDASYLQFHVRAGSNNAQVDNPNVTVAIIR